MSNFTSISSVGQIDLRLAFRKLLNASQAAVPAEVAGDKTPAKWLASCNRADLESLIKGQDLEAAILAVANGLALPTGTDPVPAVSAAKDAVASAPVVGVKAAAAGTADMSVLAGMIAPFLNIGLDLAAIDGMVKKAVQAALDGAEPRVLVVKGPVEEKKTEEARHCKLERLLLYVAQRQHVFLVGPAGTGKSHAAHQVANLLGLDFYSISVGLQSTQADLFGFMNAHGNYVETEFYRAYKNGGVFCLDEMDGGSANVLNALNSALANGSVAFPCGRVQRHANFVVVATGNTWGSGKTLEYVGRAVLDGAFLSRFARLFWPVDEKLELKLGPVPQWTKYVQAVRKLFNDRGVKYIVAPRISIAGGSMILAGQSVADTVDDYLRSGLTQDANKILDSVVTPTIPNK